MTEITAGLQNHCHRRVEAREERGDNMWRKEITQREVSVSLIPGLRHASAALN